MSGGHEWIRNNHVQRVHLPRPPQPALSFTRGRAQRPPHRPCPSASGARVSAGRACQGG
jgi:hypothetical protein